MAKITQQDIADVLKISKYAVSRALADKSGVSEATREVVLKAADNLGYKPNKQKDSALSPEVLFVFQSNDTVHGEFWVKILRGAQEEAQRMGIRTGLRMVQNASDIADLHDGIAGIVLSGPLDSEVFEVAAQLHIPLVRTSPGPILDRIDRVMVADFEAGQMVANHLIELGHTRAIFAEGTPHLIGRADRYHGFDHAFPNHVEAITFDEQIGIGPQIDRIFSQPNPPTAIFCASDGIGVNAISELLRRGIRVPEDVSVIGYLDTAAAIQIAPALTTVHVPVRQMGIAIMQCLFKRMQDNNPERRAPRRIQLVPEFIIRQSTAQANPTPIPTSKFNRPQSSNSQISTNPKPEISQDTAKF
ncbi:MAG: LacI family DNA-binding transcriptional regulator [Alphaproteobacteria bacterium]|nr:LacI family DNA-binding transcriptional regulator [Alphaproteobacteria bacterium]